MRRQKNAAPIAGLRGGSVGLRQPAWPPAGPVSVRPYVQRPVARPEPSRRDRVRSGPWQAEGGRPGVHRGAQVVGGPARPASRRATPAWAGPSAVPDLNVLRRAIAILTTEVHGARLARHQLQNVGLDRQPVALGRDLR